jgi:hypothetical protein
MLTKAVGAKNTAHFPLFLFVSKKGMLDGTEHEKREIT